MGCAFELNELKKESPIDPAKTLILICPKHLEHYTHIEIMPTVSIQDLYIVHIACLSTVALHTISKDHLKKMTVWLPGCSLLPTLATFISITQLSCHAPQMQEDIPNGAQPHSTLLTKRCHSWIDLLLIKELSMEAL
jgi:hypothetical protein